VVCLAGGPGADAGYLEDLGALSRTHELIVPDARGTGGSPPPRETAGYGFDRLAADVESLRSHLRLEEMSLLAHSAACTTALVYASRHPKRIGALVLVAPSRHLFEGLEDDTNDIFRRRSDEAWFPAASSARERLNRGADPGELPNLVAALAPASYARWGERERAHASSMAPANWEAVGWFWAAQVDGGEVRRRLGEVEAPVLVTTGDMDAATGVAAGAGWAKCFPHGRHVDIAGSGHNPWVDQPVRFVEVVTGFLAGIS
jgi:pimeloyl-ACP methyl ester carboxylesterase